MPQRINRYDPAIQDNKTIDMVFPKVEAPYTSLSGLRSSLLQGQKQVKEDQFKYLDRLKALQIENKMPTDFGSLRLYGDEIGIETANQYAAYAKPYFDKHKELSQRLVSGDLNAEVELRDLHNNMQIDKGLLNLGINAANLKTRSAKIAEEYTDDPNNYWRAYPLHEQLFNRDGTPRDLASQVIPLGGIEPEFDPLEYADKELKGIKDSMTGMKANVDGFGTLTYESRDGVTGQRATNITAGIMNSPEMNKYFSLKGKAALAVKERNIQDPIEKEKFRELLRDDTTYGELLNKEIQNEKANISRTMVTKYAGETAKYDRDTQWLTDQEKANAEKADRQVGVGLIQTPALVGNFVDIDKSGKASFNRDKWNNLPQAQRDNVLSTIKIDDLWSKVKNLGFNLDLPDEVRRLLLDDKNKDLVLDYVVKAVDKNDLGVTTPLSLAWDQLTKDEKDPERIKSGMQVLASAMNNRGLGSQIEQKLAENIRKTHEKAIGTTFDFTKTSNKNAQSQMNAFMISLPQNGASISESDSQILDFATKSLKPDEQLIKNFSVMINPANQELMLRATVNVDEKSNDEDIQGQHIITYSLSKTNALNDTSVGMLKQLRDLIPKEQTGAAHSIDKVLANYYLPINNIQMVHTLDFDQKLTLNVPNVSNEIEVQRVRDKNGERYRIFIDGKKLPDEVPNAADIAYYISQVSK